MPKLNFRHLAAALLLLACSWTSASAEAAPQTGQAALTHALQQYLVANGDLCLGKFDWPIEVSAQDSLDHTRDALQMPMLEKLGLVSAVPAMAKRQVDGAEQMVPVQQYALSNIGRIYYIPRQSQMASSSGQVVQHTHDLCGGKVGLDKLQRWDPPTQTAEGWETTLYYSYTFAPTWWADSAQGKAAFPVFAALLKGQGKLQLQQRFKWVGKHWVPITLI